jgi:hypothetical protein
MSVGLVVWLRVEHLPSMSKPSKGKTGREKGERERERERELYNSFPECTILHSHQHCV